MNNTKLYHIGLSKGDVGKYVLLPGDPARAAHIATFFDEAHEVAFSREYRSFTGTVAGIKISTMSTGIGCPSLAIGVEELVQAGAETFIRVGTAGAIQRHVKLADLTISSGAIREEGTTRQYVPLSYPAVADLDVTLALREAAKKLAIRHHVGISHCKDAFFMESAQDSPPLPLEEHNQMLWKTWERAKVLSTSMEAAALFVVSTVKGVRAGEVLANIGLLYEHTPIVKKVGVDEAIKVAIEAVKILESQRR